MKDLKDLISILESRDLVAADEGLLEQIYQGRTKKRPIKVLNPDPDIDYGGEVLETLDEERNYHFRFINEKDVIKSTGKVTSVHMGFDIPDIYSPLEGKRKTGRFSFQYEDLPMPKNKPNYRRILFFLADNTNPRPIHDYFEGANKIDFKDKGFYVLAQKNENGNPSGLAYIFDYKSVTYYFANFDDGELEGFAFAFTSSGDSYVFKDAFMFHKGKKTTLYRSVIDNIKKDKENGGQTVISWS